MCINISKQPDYSTSRKSIYTVVSLFAGAGGIDIGFENKGFKVIWANDIDKDACETYASWCKGVKIECGDITKIDYSKIPKSDVILGGFPCQGFSLGGSRRIDDSRNLLYRSFIKLVELNQPKAFVAENVKGLLTIDNGQIFEAIKRDFEDKGYVVNTELLDASDYGVPQKRERVFIVGIRTDLEVEFKFPKKIFDSCKVTLEQVLRDIAEPKKTDICSGTYSSRYMSRNRKRDWREVSFTIPAMAKQVPLHPSSPDMVKIDDDTWVFGHGQTRRLSWQEAAAIQTFPSNVKFSGDLESKYKQIGNAVPVLLAEKVAESLYNTLNGCLEVEEELAIGA